MSLNVTSSLRIIGPQFDALETFYLSTINSEVFPIAIYKEFTRNSNPLQMETKLARLSIGLDQNMVLRFPISCFNTLLQAF